MPTRWLTLKEAAQVSGFSRESLKEMADRGEVPSTKRPSKRFPGARGWRYFRREDMVALRRQMEAGFSDVQTGEEGAAA